MKNIIKLLRVKHYFKNLLIFLPLIFSGNFFNSKLLLKTLIGFVSFSLMCSVIYIINDIRDIEKDRNHPTKRNRPIASGTVSKNLAAGIAICCGAISFLICILFCGSNGVLCEIIYLILNILYSMKLKDIPIVDIAILVSGFFLRVLFGSVITEIEISAWLFLTVIAVSFYLGLGKRRNEMKLKDFVEGGTRKVLTYYNYAFLDKNMYMCMALANVFYALWAADHVKKGMLWTVPLVIIISMKYSLIVEGDSDGDPIEVILHDGLLLALIAVYVIAVFLMMYVIK